MNKTRLATGHDVSMKPYTYDFVACIHPKHGGDDYVINGSITAYTEERAGMLLRKHLSRKSALPDDFKITPRVHS